MEGFTPAYALPSLGHGPSSVCLGPCQMSIPQAEVSSCRICGLFKYGASSCCSPACLAPAWQRGSLAQPPCSSSSCTRRLSGCSSCTGRCEGLGAGLFVGSACRAKEMEAKCLLPASHPNAPFPPSSSTCFPLCSLQCRQSRLLSQSGLDLLVENMKMDMGAWRLPWGWGGAGGHCLLGISTGWVMVCPCSIWWQCLTLLSHWADAWQVLHPAHAPPGVSQHFLDFL